MRMTGESADVGALDGFDAAQHDADILGAYGADVFENGMSLLERGGGLPRTVRQQVTAAQPLQRALASSNGLPIALARSSAWPW